MGLGEPEDRVAVPGRRRDPVPVKQDLLAQRPSRALHGSPFDLVDHMTGWPAGRDGVGHGEGWPVTFRGRGSVR